MQMSKLKTVLTLSRNHFVLFRNVAVSATAEVNGEQDTPVEGKPWQEIPGPTTLPVIRQIHHFLPGGKFYKLTDTEVGKIALATYGPLVRLDGLLGKPTTFLLFDPDSVAKILRGENWLPYRPGFESLEYYRTTYKYNNKKTNEPTGLASDHFERWKKFRSTVNPVMLDPKTLQLYRSPLDEVSKDMIERMKSLKGEDNIIKSKFDTEMNLWALESIGVVALGTRLNCFDPNLPEDSPARKLINIVHDIFLTIETLDYRPSFWRYFSTPAFRRGMKVYEEVENLTKYFIDKAKAEYQLKKKNDGEKGVLEKLLEIDERIAHIMASDMLFAGGDTTANAVIFMLYLLATNPEKQEKLRADILSKEDKKSYLKACVKESLRLLPPGPGNIRKTTKEYNILGYKIPKNVFVTFMHQEMSQFEEQFKNAKEFIPERWIVPKDDPLYHGNAHPFAYSPFGFGARMCIDEVAKSSAITLVVENIVMECLRRELCTATQIDRDIAGGRRIAEMEIETFISRVLQNFQVGWFGPPMKINQILINYASEPFNFTFKDL